MVVEHVRLDPGACTLQWQGKGAETTRDDIHAK